MPVSQRKNRYRGKQTEQGLFLFNIKSRNGGTPYQYEDQIYKLWQTHDATQQGDWTPDKAVSLWGICHTKDPKLAKLFVTPSGTRGMYMKDDCCKYDGKIYRSKVDNNVYNPKDYPQNWEEVEIL